MMMPSLMLGSTLVAVIAIAFIVALVLHLSVVVPVLRVSDCGPLGQGADGCGKREYGCNLAYLTAGERRAQC
jgi:hypothetical protein